MKNRIKRIKRIVATVLILILMFGIVDPVGSAHTAQAADGKNKYAKLLAMSLDFFDENACGTDVSGLGISWRGNCHTYDAEAELSLGDNFPEAYRSLVDPDGNGKVDLSGGYHDAGDHVKFNLTMGFAGSSLALSEYLHPGIYEKAGAKEHLLAVVKRNADYLMKTTFLDGSGKVVTVCHVVGNGNTDHGLWEAPEVQNYERISYWLTAERNNTAVCCEMAAAIAGAAWLYKDTDAAYASKCIRYAKALLDFGRTNQGNCLDGLATFYDTSGYSGSEMYYAMDETAMAEAWLWVLGEGSKPAYTVQEGNYSFEGAYYGDYYFYCWDKVWQGFSALMYKATDESTYKDALKFAYLYKTNLQGLSTSYYNYFDVTWGVSRYNCAMQMTALALAKGDKESAYAKAARFQMDYLLGNNDYRCSFLIGYGNNPVRIHHRAANPEEGNAKYTLRGALVGGPDKNGYLDDVHSYQYTEPALDYNACFALACAGLAELYTGTSSDPEPEPQPDPSENAAEVIDAGERTMVVKQKLDVAGIFKEEIGNGKMPVKYKSGNTRIASVSRKGIVTAKKEGSVSINGYIKVQKKYVLCATITLEISKPVFSFTRDEGKRFDLTYAGEELDLEAYISGIPEGQAYSWSIPSKCKCASLNGATLYAVKNGSVKVSCVIGEGKYAAKYKASLKLRIPKLAGDLNIKAGKTKTVQLKNVSTYTEVKWEGDEGLTLTALKDPRKIKVSGGIPGEYRLAAYVNGQSYTMNVRIR
ncbi:MAG: glycoside hydrolase family 9 protein [Lachnospiraceae bacterium]|nr:glycoside hydrolase family 9 protein [Lachnospiraceae bacterium]